MIDEKELIKDIKEWSQEKEIEWTSESVISLLKSAPKVDKWIPCSEKLPEEEKYYIVTILNYDKKPVVEYCLFQNTKWYIVADGNYEENTTWKEEIKDVIAWQSLPDAYTG
ncbi:MAG: DUF551 domain-containing protein [Ruminococcus flavefaciens]|nr:DUF551 domain-containing protein [Ruminococcus flavefaciens]